MEEIYDFRTHTILKGEVCEQYTVCGKIGCRCTKGEKHGPYYYRIWRDGLHVRKIYIKEADLQEIKEACMSYKFARKLLRDYEAKQADIIGNIRRLQRQTRSLIKSI